MVTQTSNFYTMKRARKYYSAEIIKRVRKQTETEPTAQQLYVHWKDDSPTGNLIPWLRFGYSKTL